MYDLCDRTPPWPDLCIFVYKNITVVHGFARGIYIPIMPRVRKSPTVESVCGPRACLVGDWVVRVCGRWRARRCVCDSSLSVYSTVIISPLASLRRSRGREIIRGVVSVLRTGCPSLCRTYRAPRVADSMVPCMVHPYPIHLHHAKSKQSRAARPRPSSPGRSRRPRSSCRHVAGSWPLQQAPPS